MSTFIHEINQGLAAQLVAPSTSSSGASYSQDSEDSKAAKNILRESFINLQVSQPRQELSTSAGIVRDLQHQGVFIPSQDAEQEALEAAIIAKVVTKFYITALEQFLDEARQADSELEWWQDIERSKLSSAYYLLQTLPIRLTRLAKTVMDALRKHRLPVRLSAFSPSSIRQLFPTTNVLQPNTLTVAIFPHLRHEPYPTSLLPTNTRLAISSSSAEQAVQSAFAALIPFLSDIHRNLSSIFYLPVELTRHECRFKKEQLEKLRDERAALIGQLLDMRHSVTKVLNASTTQESISALQLLSSHLTTNLDGSSPAPQSIHTLHDAVRYLETLASEYLPAQSLAYKSSVASLRLQRPPLLTRNWPKLVFLPPLLLYGVRAAYSSRENLEQIAIDAVDTLKHFWRDWLLAPLKEVVDTVRAGNDEGVIITHESVQADLDSLERMTLSLAQDKLHYTPEQMAALSQQIRVGDLTPVMQIYEDDIRSPLKSAVGGTLLRTLLVQVQKAKVDINLAVSGIDKLLKSQELTFAFVGVAPAMTLTYVTFGYLRSLWFGNKGKSRYGGRRHRAVAWTVLRRIERLLITSSSHADTATIDPRTSGLLLLSTTRLRGYAERHLPTNSRIREGFLQDVKDLENPSFGRKAKLRIVDRMWSSWGEVLGWRRIDLL